MESRKNPTLETANKRPFYFQIALLLTMSLVVAAFEWETELEEHPLIEFSEEMDAYTFDVTISTIETPKPPKPKLNKPRPVVSNKFVEAPEEEILEQMEFQEPVIEDIDITEIPLPPVEETNSWVPYSEVMPEPENGYDAFYAFLGKKIKYPSQARALEIEGKVFVKFIVEKDGQMTDFEIIRGIGAGCDEEVLRVLNLPNVPRWTPGRSGGRKVRVRMIIPIDFRLK